MGTEISRSEELRWQNRKRILAAIRRAGSISRTDLAASTGMSPSTISAITTMLLKESIILELREEELANTDTVSVRRGRPQILLTLNATIASIVAIDVSLNRIAMELLDYSGNTTGHSVTHFPTMASGGDELLSAISAQISQLLSNHPDKAAKLAHIAIGVQGVTNAAGDTLLWSPSVRDKNIAFSETLSAIFSVPVVLANDCMMIAEALRWIYPDEYSGDFAAILFSYGIGMGLYLNGQPFSGTRSSAAEFGHMVYLPDGALCRCGQRGCIEAYAGNYAIYRCATDQDETTPPPDRVDNAAYAQLTEKARDQLQQNLPSRELQAFRQAGSAIGYGLRSLFSLIDPVPLAFVGPGSEVFDLIEDDLRAALTGKSDWTEDKEISIRCYPHEHPMILQGCAITSLLYLDKTQLPVGNLNSGSSQTETSALQHIKAG